MDRETRGNALELEIDEVSGNEVFVKSIFYREVSLYPYRVISWPASSSLLTTITDFGQKDDVDNEFVATPIE